MRVGRTSCDTWDWDGWELQDQGSTCWTVVSHGFTAFNFPPYPFLLKTPGLSFYLLQGKGFGSFEMRGNLNRRIRFELSDNFIAFKVDGIAYRTVDIRNHQVQGCTVPLQCQVHLSTSNPF